MTKISILLPLFNDELFIRKAISSILSNTYQEYEIIVINDGSTDNSIEELNYFEDNRIKLYNKSNSGLIETLNYGIQKCSSEIIMRMDADDEIERDKISRQIQAFKKIQPIVLGTGGTIIDNSSILKRNINVPENHNDILKKINQLKASIIHASIMVNKETLLKIGGYDNKFEIAEDYELFLRLSRYGELRNINYPLYNIRKNEDNISKTKSKTQTLNTLIARKAYAQDKTITSVSNELYFRLKPQIENSLFFKLLVFTNSKISDHKQENLFNLILKILRKFIIFLINR